MDVRDGRSFVQYEAIVGTELGPPRAPDLRAMERLLSTAGFDDVTLGVGLTAKATPAFEIGATVAPGASGDLGQLGLDVVAALWPQATLRPVVQPRAWIKRSLLCSRCWQLDGHAAECPLR